MKAALLAAVVASAPAQAPVSGSPAGRLRIDTARVDSVFAKFGSVHPNGVDQTGDVYGTTTCFPLPTVEREGNPNVP